jgi:hypothetical protein
MTAGLKITLIVNRGTPRTFELPASALVGSGRAADVRVPDVAMAPLHLRLSRVGTEVTAIALAPGVWLDGVELAVEELCTVTGRTVDVGPVRLVPAVDDRDIGDGRLAHADDNPRGRTESLAREIVRDLMGGAGDGEDSLAPELEVETGPAAGQRFTLGQLDTRVVVGRGEGATWVLLDPDLSRSHAAVERRSDGVRLYDLGSKNGTRVEDKPVSVGPPGELLEDGAEIGLGDTRLRFTDPAAAMLAELERTIAAGQAGAGPPGAPGAVTHTRPSRPRALAATPRTPAPPPAAPRRVSVGAIAAALVAVVAIGLLVALFVSST